MGGLMWHVRASGMRYDTRSVILKTPIFKAHRGMEWISLSFELTWFPLDSQIVGTQVCSVMDHIPELHSDQTHMTFNVHCTLTTNSTQQH